MRPELLGHPLLLEPLGGLGSHERPEPLTSLEEHDSQMCNPSARAPPETDPQDQFLEARFDPLTAAPRAQIR